MENRRTIVLVLKNGKGFSFSDVQLIAKHIHGKWESDIRPRIICLWDQASEKYDLGWIEILPLRNKFPGTWTRIELYSPAMEEYRPFLYVDLDTAIIESLERIFELVTDPAMFIPLEDFYQKDKLATGLAWIPANSKKISSIWKAWKGEVRGSRMDKYLRKVVEPDMFWQNLTSKIISFKPKDAGTRAKLLDQLPKNTIMVCFHGKPRIPEAINIKWVDDYIKQEFIKAKVTVIIPYNRDRGWLKEAVESVPEGVQLLISQGEGNWPENFNKVLDQATGDYIKWLHEDDMLTPNSIADSIEAIESQGVDFIHGEAVEIYMNSGRPTKRYKPAIEKPTVADLLKRNIIHSATLMYKREVFEKFKMDETLNTAEEFEFNLRCLKAGMKIGYCAKPLAFYRRHKEQKVRVVPVSEKNKEREMVKSNYK